MRDKIDNYDKITRWVSEVVDVVYGQLGTFIEGDSKLLNQLIGFKEVYETNKLDNARIHTVELGYASADLLNLQSIFENKLSNSQNYNWSSSTYIRTILMSSLGHALIEFGDDYNYSEFAAEYEDEALATVCGMKLSSFIAGLKPIIETNNISLAAKIKFSKTRRGYKSLTYYHSAHCVDDYAISPSHDIESLQLELNSRAKYRNKKLPLQQIFNTNNENEYLLALTTPTYATTVANILSLHLPSFLSSLEETLLKEAKRKIKNTFSQVANIPPSTFNVEVEELEAKIDTVGFINLVSTHGIQHEAYKGNKKLITYTLTSGVEIGIEQAAKKVSFWIAQQFVTKKMMPFIKNTYPKASKESQTYGRHSGLRIYSQLAWEEVAKLNITNIGEAKLVLNELNTTKVNH